MTTFDANTLQRLLFAMAVGYSAMGALAVVCGIAAWRMGRKLEVIKDWMIALNADLYKISCGQAAAAAALIVTAENLQEREHELDAHHATLLERLRGAVCLCQSLSGALFTKLQDIEKLSVETRDELRLAVPFWKALATLACESEKQAVERSTRILEALAALKPKTKMDTGKAADVHPAVKRALREQQQKQRYRDPLDELGDI